MQGFSTTRFADAAVDFLKDYGASDRDTPFLAYVSFTVPHDPRTPPCQPCGGLCGNGHAPAAQLHAGPSVSYRAHGYPG